MEGTGFWSRLWARLRGGGDPSRPERASEGAPARSDGEAVVDKFELDGRLPPSSLDRILAIRAMSTDLEQRARDVGLIEEMIELQRLKSSHLPLLVQSYVAIPPEHRAEVFRETGRSASFLLNERLDKVLARLHEMSRQLARGNIDAFTQNIRFVDTRYGSNPFD